MILLLIICNLHFLMLSLHECRLPAYSAFANMKRTAANLLHMATLFLVKKLPKHSFVRLLYNNYSVYFPSKNEFRGPICFKLDGLFVSHTENV